MSTSSLIEISVVVVVFFIFNNGQLSKFYVKKKKQTIAACVELLALKAYVIPTL